MPGHKRNSKLIKKYGIWQDGLSPYDIDITEIKGFDNLHNPTGIIRRLEELISRVYGSDESFISVNGSTALILAVMGILGEGEKVLIARNCHISVYHAIELYSLNPIYIDGETDDLDIYKEISVESVEEKLRKDKIRLVVITSPTYDGYVSDIEKISEISHRYGSLLLVDEAHGAHFGIDKTGYFCKNATRLGADFSVISLHKTLPSYTQTAALNINSTCESIKNEIRRGLHILETTSPSYVLMAGIENAVRTVFYNSKELFDNYIDMLLDFSTKIEGLKNITLYRPKNIGYDIGKLIITAGYGSGDLLYNSLFDEFKLVMEMKSRDYVLGMTSIFDDWNGFYRLIEALKKLDSSLIRKNEFSKKINTIPKKVLTPKEARKLAKKFGVKYIPYSKAAGEIASDYTYFYPPGIPLIVPGELIDREIIDRISTYLENGVEIVGGADRDGIFICTYGKECYRKG